MPVKINRLIPGEPAPELDVPLFAGGRWRLSEQDPQKFTLMHFFRGVHCSFCQPEVEKLQAMQDLFTEIGISILSVSMDCLDRAEKAAKEWAITNLPFAYGLTEAQARSWGLYLSSRVKEKEPEIFSEPAAFLVDKAGVLFAEFQSSVPWLRFDIDILYRGIQLAIQRGAPPRGEHL
jgi:peroxiredoxin